MNDTATIQVTLCAVCGSHATESDYDSTPQPRTTGQIGQVGMFVPFMAKCPLCGLLACFSCLSNGWCCERANEGGQMALFE
jgi:hypothetical protein